MQKKQKPLPAKAKVYAHIQKYAHASNLTAWWLLLSTLVSFTLCWVLPWRWSLLLLCAGLRLRLFVIFHDMGHQAFFSSSKLNNYVGTMIAPIIWTPYSYWNRGHNHHHKVSNNLDRKQYAQTSPWTVHEFHQKPRLYKWFYTLIYGPFTLWSIVPFIYFVCLQRFFSNWYENILQLLWLLLITWTGGLEFIKYDASVAVLSAIGGFFLFHVQHTFPGAYRKRTEEWDYYENGMRGSSFLSLPWYLAYFTFGIEYHHIHHLNTRVPGYRLKQCHDEAGGLFDCVPQLTLYEAFATLPFSLYDEVQDIFVNVYEEIHKTEKDENEKTQTLDENQFKTTNIEKENTEPING